MAFLGWARWRTVATRQTPQLGLGDDLSRLQNNAGGQEGERYQSGERGTYKSTVKLLVSIIHDSYHLGALTRHNHYAPFSKSKSHPISWGRDHARGKAHT